uniref:Uncharacterized protein n=1 Tax=Meloidogyne enterolobii TaxID=390850 RepID=A0A6V7VRG5_MELEN|nr:unnamed protein product [Meloidogyne enterolobii]
MAKVDYFTDLMNNYTNLENDLKQLKKVDWDILNDYNGKNLNSIVQTQKRLTTLENQFFGIYGLNGFNQNKNNNEGILARFSLLETEMNELKTHEGRITNLEKIQKILELSPKGYDDRRLKAFEAQFGNFENLALELKEIISLKRDIKNIKKLENKIDEIENNKIIEIKEKTEALKQKIEKNIENRIKRFKK